MRERERERSYVYRDDGTYCIRISPLRQKRRNLRWQVDAYYRGHKAKTRVGGTFSGDDGRELAEDLADALWDDYLAGAHRAPEAAPRTVADAVSRFGERKTGRRGRVLSPATARAYHSQLQAPLLGRVRELTEAVGQLHARDVDLEALGDLRIRLGAPRQRRHERGIMAQHERPSGR
jgi:hypothetical protein